MLGEGARGRGRGRGRAIVWSPHYHGGMRAIECRGHPGGVGCVRQVFAMGAGAHGQCTARHREGAGLPCTHEETVRTCAISSHAFVEYIDSTSDFTVYRVA